MRECRIHNGILLLPVSLFISEIKPVDYLELVSSRIDETLFDHEPQVAVPAGVYQLESGVVSGFIRLGFPIDKMQVPAETLHLMSFFYPFLELFIF